jgi:hypothetical protein
MQSSKPTSARSRSWSRNLNLEGPGGTSRLIGYDQWKPTYKTRIFTTTMGKKVNETYVGVLTDVPLLIVTYSTLHCENL